MKSTKKSRLWAYDAKAARYEAEYVEAKAEYEKLRREMRDYKVDGFKPIRSELEKALADAFAANPEHLDAATLEFLILFQRNTLRESVGVGAHVE